MFTVEYVKDLKWVTSLDLINKVPNEDSINKNHVYEKRNE